LHAGVHVARNGGEFFGLRIAQIFERDGIEILELVRFEILVERRKMIEERPDLSRVRAVDVVEAAARSPERDRLRSERCELEQIVVDRDSGLLLEILRDLLPVFRIEGPPVMRSVLISVASARAIRGAATPALAAIIAELCRNRRLDRCFNMTATSQERSREFSAPCYEMSECSFVRSGPKRTRPNGAASEPEGVNCEKMVARNDETAASPKAGVEADRVSRPDGSGIVSSSPPKGVSERRTRLL
jgi:hypothetical protein